MVEAPNVQIRELEGARREVILTARAKPYRGAGWSSRLRNATTWYAGNPQATIQVLGPELGATTLEGVWRSRYLRGAVLVTGFPEVEDPEDLVAIFRALQFGGALLEVEWGPEYRRGILEEFEAKYDRVEDMRWTASFAWRDNGQEAPRASARTRPQEALRTAQIEVDDAATFEPPGITPAWSDRVFGAISGLRNAVGGVFDGLRDARAVARVPAQAVGAASAAARSVRAQAEELMVDLIDSPYESVLASDSVAAVVEAEVYRRDLGSTVRTLEAQSIREARELARQRTPQALDVLFMPAGASLRRVALTYYGDADSWTQIAEASGLTTSILEADALVVVPARAATLDRPRAMR